MSLDGFIAGPNDIPGNGLGDGGEALHEWATKLRTWRESHGYEGGEEGPDAEILDEMFAGAGAVIVGRRMYDNAEGWGDEPPFRMPVIIVTHRVADSLEKQGGTTFHFVDGAEAALERAREAAGDQDVAIGGGASVIQQYLAAGLVDEFQVHIVPLFLGGGVRLFEHVPDRPFEKVRAIDSPEVTHLKYKLR
jgi:dihydrofolate reductase